MKYACFFLIVLLFGITFYEKSKVKSLDYEQFFSETLYTSDQPIHFYESSYATEMKQFFYDTPNSLHDLFDHSELVLKVKIDKKEVYGEGIINHATIQKVIKGDKKENETIQFYELVSSLRPLVGVTYIAGTTPLPIGKEYYVFLKTPLYPNRKGTYIYSSLEYGYFSLNPDTKIYKRTKPNQMIYLNETLNYDFVQRVGETNYYTDFEHSQYVPLEEKSFEQYFSIKKEILEKYED